MNRDDWLSSIARNPTLSPTQWPMVRTDALPPLKAMRFKIRKRALDLYFEGNLSIREILQKCGISKPELYRVRDRALTIRDDGQPWGYLACIPGFHIKAYELKPNTACSRAGTVTRFFRQHPELLELLSAWALGRRSPDVGMVRGRHIARIWVAFEKACKDAGIPESEYPSREAIRRKISRIRKQHFRRGTRLTYGKDAADIASTGGGGPIEQAEVPYQCVQLDGHRLDGLITVEVTDADGTQRDLPLERLWLLVLIDVASRSILSYHISLAANYSSDDVLDCIANALKPWSQRDLSSERIGYKPGAGVPSGSVNGCAWRCFDALAFDNAMAHTSVWLQERVIHTVGPEINTGYPARALSRAIVERFFRTFEDESLHRWPSTTGSGPNDPRREQAEKAAERLKITLDDLETITDVTIANYNATPHKSLNGRSPLEYVRYYDQHGLTIPRHIPKDIRDALPLYDREFRRRIAGNKKTGRRPFVVFMGAHYRSEALATLIDHIGEPITLLVNVLDIRQVHGFLSDGTSVGMLTANDTWLRQPHSLRTRRAILKLIKQGELSRETYNPVGDHLMYLAKRARKTRRDRNKLIQAAREAHTSTTSVSENAPPPSPRFTRRRHISISMVSTR